PGGLTRPTVRVAAESTRPVPGAFRTEPCPRGHPSRCVPRDTPPRGRTPPVDPPVLVGSPRRAPRTGRSGPTPITADRRRPRVHPVHGRPSSSLLVRFTLRS